MTAQQTPALRVTGVSHAYTGRPRLAFPDFTLARSEAVVLLGPSGSGKSTLLMLMAGLLRLQAGEIDIAGERLGQSGGAGADHWRGRTIGIVLQSFQLLRHLSVQENLMAAQYFSGRRTDAAAARDTLAALGILALADDLPHRLSRGQAQRAAIARAVINAPALLLADEPTSSLDDGNAAASIELLLGESRRLGAALLIATHDGRVKSRIARSIGLTA
jgi:putative ABC transport system ATP-binding protein